MCVCSQLHLIKLRGWIVNVASAHALESLLPTIYLCPVTALNGTVNTLTNLCKILSHSAICTILTHNVITDCKPQPCEYCNTTQPADHILINETFLQFQVLEMLDIPTT